MKGKMKHLHVHAGRGLSVAPSYSWQLTKAKGPLFLFSTGTRDQNNGALNYLNSRKLPFAAFEKSKGSSPIFSFLFFVTKYFYFNSYI